MTRRTVRRPSALATVLACLLLGGPVSAQIGHDPAAFAAALGHATAPADDAFETEAGVRVELERRGGVLHTVRGEAELDEAALQGVATVVAAASGLGAEIEGPVADFLRTRLPDLAGRGQVVVGLERFRLTLDVRGDAVPYELTFGLALAEIDEAAFPEARHALGPADAPIVVREFSDFQCPFCRRFAAEMLPRLEEELLARGDVRFEFHHFPLRSIHANAMRAAEASECAADAEPADPEAFWRFHDALFEHQAAWSGLADPDDYLVGLAEGVDVDAGAVSRCLAGDERRETVERAHAAAVELQLRGTPSVFVDGFPIEDFTSLAAYREAIALSRAFAGDAGAEAE